MIEIFQASDAEQIQEAKSLFREYAASLNVDLCFQNFDAELASLPGDYAPPRGRLLLAEVQGRAAGCIALRPLSDETCEMKRLFVRPEFRGQEIGRALVETLIGQARQMGYQRMRLDTMPAMQSAIKLYRSLGFQEIEPYRHNPVVGALFLELDLRSTV